MFAFNTPALALLTRSLREDNRLKQTYFARGGLICFILMMLWSSQNTYGYMGAPGLAFFSKVVLTNFFFITLTGLSYFAGAIAEEKEEGTLGLLRMTNLGPLTILLGKSSSRLLGIGLLLFVQLPFTLLAVTLGGVSTHQVLAAYLALGAYIFFVCNLALLFSVIFERVGVASVVTLLALLCFFFLPEWGKQLLDLLTVRFRVVNPTNLAVQSAYVGLGWMGQASAFNQLLSILTNGFAGRLLGFQVLGNLALGVFFFGLAWWGFDAFTRERRPGVLTRKLPALRPSRFGMPGAGRTWDKAVWWKDFFLLHGGWNTAVVKVLAFLGFVGLIVYNTASVSIRGADQQLQLGASMLETFLLVFGVEMAFGASRIFHAEIQGKTLAGLVGLPTTVARIAYQKVGALALSGVPSLVFAGVGGMMILTSGRSNLTEALTDDDFWFGVFIVGAQSVLFLHVTAYLSLMLKRLALAVALAAMVMGNMLFMALVESIVRPGPSKALFGFYHCGILALAAFFHFKIGDRLRRLAATEG